MNAILLVFGGLLIWWDLKGRPLPWTSGSGVPQTSNSKAVPVESDNFGAATVTQSPPPLEKALYVVDVRFTFHTLEKDRFSEVTMRVFNGSGRVVELGRVTGNIKFNAPNNTYQERMGTLPTPALRHDVPKTIAQLEEWFLILEQRVPASEADKILAMRAAGIPIHFDLTGLTIEVFPKDDKKQVQPLPLWSGFSYHSEHGYGRIISAVVNIQMGADARVSSS